MITMLGTYTYKSYLTFRSARPKLESNTVDKNGPFFQVKVFVCEEKSRGRKEIGERSSTLSSHLGTLLEEDALYSMVLYDCSKFLNKLVSIETRLH